MPDHARQQPPALPSTWPDGKLRSIPSSPLVNSGGQSNFSRSHEHATRCNTCTRHPNDAAVPAPYLIRSSTKTYAKTYASLCVGGTAVTGHAEFPRAATSLVTMTRRELMQHELIILSGAPTLYSATISLSFDGGFKWQTNIRTCQAPPG